MSTVIFDKKSLLLHLVFGFENKSCFFVFRFSQAF